jgi:AcrR family transcriptional regulator
MPNVKSERRYDSARRKEQARQTRAAILEAAQRLFGERGYASSTIEAIASEAGVAVDTVYATFGSKRGVLSNLMDIRVGGDDQPVGVLDRPGPQRVRREPSQRRQLAAFATDVTARIERSRPVDDIIRSAAAVDLEIATMRFRLHETRFLNLQQFVGWLAANGPLRQDLSEADAAAIIWSLTSPEIHRLLRVDRAWSPERYSEWLAETLTRTLLP